MTVFRSSVVDEHNDLNSAINLYDEWLSYYVRRIQQPGIAVGIVHRGELVFGKAHGYADLESKTPVTFDTRFRIASVSKTFTATAIMQLKEAGKLKLDDPISDYLDWFNLQYEGAPEITIRHCLTQTSGLPRDGITPVWTDDAFYEWADVVENTKKRAPVMAPLEEFSYSNLNYSLLGGVIQAISGQSWSDYVRENILNPLGMTQTLTGAKGGEENLATGYLLPDSEYAREGMHVVDAKGFDSATGMASCLNDLVKYANFHLSNEDHEILSLYSLRDMHHPHSIYEDWSGGYGLGSQIFRFGDVTCSGHSGGYKGFLTMFTLVRKHNIAVIVLTNASGSDPFLYAEKAYKIVYPELLKIAEVKKEVDPAWQQYAGVYEISGFRDQVVIRNNQLQVLPVSAPDMPPLVLEPTDQAHVFKIQVKGNPGETAHFEFDENGDVVKLWIRNEYSYRVR